MNGKITDAKNLVFLLSVIFIAIFVGVSFFNAYAGAILLAVSVLVMMFGVLLYGMDDKDY